MEGKGCYLFLGFFVLGLRKKKSRASFRVFGVLAEFWTEYSLNTSKNIEARSRNHFCRAKTKHITYSECVSVALVLQDAERMRRILLSSAVCLAAYYFSTSQKRHDFRGKKIIEQKFVFWFYLQILSATFLTAGSIRRDNIINVHKSSRKVSGFHVRY